ncbi:double-strand break repair protein AddB [Dongia sp.]|uniref:double-strand break repair protein AddB n=1 Tax=Dongia sp. TaxID=1977262 RepID=UPI0034A2A969
MGLFDRDSRICCIPTGVSFVDALAFGLMQETAADPLRLSTFAILLPNRRACRAVQEAFLRLGASGGRALMLPRLMPLGDLDEGELGLQGVALDLSLGEGLGDEVPPAMPGMRRHLLLAQLVQKAAAATLPGGGDMSFDQAARLAAELARLLDQVETERLDFAEIRNLAPEELAEHWQLTLRFLDILQQNWPDILRSEGAVDAATRRNLLLARQCRLWRERPPPHPVIAAGSTGSIPASADLIATIAGLPLGLVILPGLDNSADDAVWQEIAADPAHPQFGLAQLLDRLQAQPKAVWLWPHAVPDGPRRAAPPTRNRLVSAALLPANATSDWPDIARTMASPAGIAELAWRDVQRIDCRTDQEEAGVIALLLREAVAQPAPYRAALVTPDRGLARRVAAELRRWGIVIDDSAGTPLPSTGPGLFFRLVAEAMAEDLAPVPLLALLKHPLAAAGLPHDLFQHQLRLLERKVLRGPRPAPGLAGLEDAFVAADLPDGADRAAVRAILDRLHQLFGPCADWHQSLPLADRLARHIRFAEALAARPEGEGSIYLWQGEAGEALAGFAAEMLQATRAMPPIEASSYAALIVELMSAVDVRPRFGLHPRLFIWGPLEARLQQVDLMVLGGLNEGIWPGDVAIDPWLSRPMRQKFGLPSLERKIGLAAHDFQQALGAPSVVMTRAQRVGGKPSVPSRWLLRLDAFLRALGIVEPIDGPSQYRGWQQRLDWPAQIVAIGRPAPKPGARYRPDRLPVTDIEKWMRDPYVLYARRILNLRPLDPLDQDAGAVDLGNLFHGILDRFLHDNPLPLPPDAEARLLKVGEEEFQQHMSRPAVWAFWWPRFCQMASWFVSEMRAREGELARIVTECKGEITLHQVKPPFTLTAKADRLDVRRDGGLVIIDYKTGKPPNSHDVTLGFSPQLPLEAAIAWQGGFKYVPAALVAALEFWHLKGGRDGSSVMLVKDQETKAIADPMVLADDAYQGLIDLVQHFSSDDAAYMAAPRDSFALAFNDYAHLARYAEWSNEGEL